MIKKIIAIGGGEIGRPGFPVETTLIDREIIRQTHKKHPKLLFIPTASSESESYANVVTKHFGNRLGCRVSVLWLLKKRLTHKEITNKVMSSDIIYVGGGNTLKMMNIWRRLGVDKCLKNAYEKGIVLSGLSAGSICWFRYGNSDSRLFTSGSKKLIRVTGLGLINAFHCPHYDVEVRRQADLKRMMRKTPLMAIALENCTALEVIDNRYRIIKSKPTARAFKVYWKGGRYFQYEIPCKKEFEALGTILRKNPIQKH